MTDSPFESDDWQRYAEHAVNDLLPKMRGSAFAIALVPDRPDVQIATQLGFMILLDKPIIAVVTPGTPVPAKMIAIADEIVEGDMKDPGMQSRLLAAIDRATKKVKGDGQPEG